MRVLERGLERAQFLEQRIRLAVAGDRGDREERGGR